MGSRREEDRNEKIIRGLMKLPPNRRCINCNSLGPQYVCTNFWTFVCTTCSGIHREFTHRVKSVSMSKFTSQEVDALQNGGNQRAKEVYLKGWDHQRQRLPENSNADKVREFIKSVYVEKKYAGGITHCKPPRDLQSQRSLDDDARRASSYHSYSQSPPYDFQYEDRCYGKQGATLSRKPGSDRGIYVGKMSSFICSPTRFNEDKFANEGSVSRFSDFSVSSGGDPVRSGMESPNFQKAHGPQRTMSSGSIGTISVKSYNSGHEPEYDAGSCQDNIINSLHSSGSLTNGTVNLFDASDAPAASSIDLFQLPGALPASSVDLFQAAPPSSASSADLCLPSQTSLPSSVDLFGGVVRQQLVSPSDKKSVEPSAPSNEGWANFDSPWPVAPTQKPEGLTVAPLPSVVVSSATFDKVSSQTTTILWPPLQNSYPQGSSLVSDSRKEGLQIFSAPIDPINAQTWNAFDNSSIMQFPSQSIRPNSEPQAAADGPLLTAGQHTILRVSEDSTNYGFQRATPYQRFPGPTGNLDFAMGPPYMQPLMEDTHPNAVSPRSTNPFDLSYESDLEPTDMFLDMSSLQAALPNAQVPPSFLGVTQPWFAQDTGTAYVPAVAQG